MALNTAPCFRSACVQFLNSPRRSGRGKDTATALLCMHPETHPNPADGAICDRDPKSSPAPQPSSLSPHGHDVLGLMAGSGSLAGAQHPVRVPTSFLPMCAGALVPAGMREACVTGFPALGFYQAQPQLVWAFGKRTGTWEISVCLSLVFEDIYKTTASLSTGSPRPWQRSESHGSFVRMSGP